ncbi:cytochrome-c peroxidase [Thiorhodovibrio litoralis]|uniref:cytochrome-c peroxidase n=1 Tax=Thiorhodovibrio litoralis TaxID=2952932 RepID=UPI0019114016|nr:cytochrome c peroxidase [Thiorhodovibrio litoralis]MBK5970050.1 cytochrome C [Thiorhodovibrio winogradskyi]WPL12976.1 Methylamine utilization protein MauG precursor [Thiorhodovibrio litoralis]
MQALSPRTAALALTTGLTAGLTPTALLAETKLTALEQLGKALFFDTQLSQPPGQACASCHSPISGWTSPQSGSDPASAVVEGAVRGRFGNRRPPMAAYASFSPPLHLDPEEDHFVGGNFWDGRASGWLLGHATADQAQGPFLNPVEQNLSDGADVVHRVCHGDNSEAFLAYFGTQACDNPVAGFNAIARAIAAFESSAEMNAFSSKYDYYLKDPERYPLTEQEALGLELFVRDDKGMCAACHPHEPGPNGEPPLFTDFTYDNLGVGRNLDNPWYGMKDFNPEGADWVDPGLGGFLKTVPRFADRVEENIGKYKVPSLRNADQRPAPGFVKRFMHNGAQASLEEVTHFYNTRDIKPVCEEIDDPKPAENCWPAPEISANLNTEELGDLGLTAEEEAAIVAFMRTLNDGWTPPKGAER